MFACGPDIQLTLSFLVNLFCPRTVGQGYDLCWVCVCVIAEYSTCENINHMRL